MTHDTSRDDRVRLDKWLWAARFFKTRALAADAIDAGRIDVNEERAKRSRLLAPGDRVRVRRPPFEHIIVVRALSETRGPATVAATLYEETPDSAKAREALATQIRATGGFADHPQGRPTKKDRREIQRWKGRA